MSSRRAIALLDCTLALAVVVAGCSRTQQTATKSTAEQLSEGRSLYEANGCATCHGAEGHGDGPLAKALHSSPRDFRDSRAFLRGYSVPQIAGTIATGFASGSNSMPSYSHLSQDERELLARYIMSLRDRKGERTP